MAYIGQIIGYKAQWEEDGKRYMEKRNPGGYMFSNADLRRLIFPLIVEQILAVSVGMVDTMMVSSVGEAATSGVSLVDMVNTLFINIFAAVATGGAVVSSQYLGQKRQDRLVPVLVALAEGGGLNVVDGHPGQSADVTHPAVEGCGRRVEAADPVLLIQEKNGVVQTGGYRSPVQSPGRLLRLPLPSRPLNILL